MIGQNDTGNMEGFRKCGLLISVVLALVAWSFLWHEQAGGFFFTLSAFLLLSVTLFKPMLLKWPYLLWKKGSDILGLVLLKVALTLLFFLVFTPIGLLARLLKRDLLSLKMPKDGWSYWDRGPDSYWAHRKDDHADMGRYEKPF